MNTQIKIVFVSEMFIIFMLDSFQFEAHVYPSVHGKNSLRCASACLVLRSRCVSLLCIVEGSVYGGLLRDVLIHAAN